MDPTLAVFTFFENVTIWGVWFWNIGHLMRTYYAKGTRGRFIGQSIARPAIHITIVHWVLVVTTYMMKGEWWKAGLSLFLVALYVFVLLVIEPTYDDDDDFWKRAKRKVKRWARSLVPKGRVAPA